MYIDSHCHIEGSQFDADREEVIERARSAGIELLVCVGNGEVAADSHEAAFKIADSYSWIYTTVGVHPHEARLYDDELEARLVDLATHPRVIAWGEIGLDYHYDNSPRETQRDVFRRQLRLARARGLPAVIHTREAEPETLELLEQEWKGSGLPGVIHCFTGTREFAERAIELGFSISFSGVVSFRNAGDLRATARALPLERILIETDAPFLAPVPYRGRRNEPAYLIETARCIAELRGLEPEELASATSENFRTLFGIAREPDQYEGVP
jgi:TatD DNase family protein